MKWSTLFLQRVFARSHIVHFAMYSCSKHIHPLQSYCEFCCLQLLLTLRRPPSWEWRWTLTSLCSVSLTCWPMLSSSTRCPGTSMTASSWKRHWLRTFLLVFFMRTSWQPCLTVIQYVASLLFFYVCLWLCSSTAVWWRLVLVLRSILCMENLKSALLFSSVSSQQPFDICIFIFCISVVSGWGWV